MQINIWKIIYLKCGERCEFIIDHPSYTHKLSSCEIIKSLKSLKKFRPERDSSPWPLRYRFSALPTELSSHLGAGYIVSSQKAFPNFSYGSSSLRLRRGCSSESTWILIYGLGLNICFAPKRFQDPDLWAWLEYSSPLRGNKSKRTHKLTLSWER